MSVYIKILANLCVIVIYTLNRLICHVSWGFMDESEILPALQMLLIPGHIALCCHMPVDNVMWQSELCNNGNSVYVLLVVFFWLLFVNISAL